MSRLKLVKDLKFWLIAIAAGLITIHLTLTWRSGNTELLSTSFLFWAAVSSLLWQKRDRLELKSDDFSSIVGFALISLVLFKSLNPGYGFTLHVTPLISMLGLGLIASGVKGLKQYWRELLLLAFFVLNQELILKFFNVSLLTAKFTFIFLWFLGFPVVQRGEILSLPTGSVQIGGACAGVGTILQLLGLALVVLLIFPTKLKEKILLPFVAVIVAFTLNGIRVALMTVLAGLSNKEAFEYWHLGDGSVIFPMISVFIFGLICRFWLLKPGSKNENSVEF
ncbi:MULTISPECIES: cyanoexosortase A [Cyanophyceae]|uniref:cyanoexosortase A n=1 Tax=Cyanophyceae TaxID=3028117 RepID=UPI00168890FE|nr:cyanoexosortase A [Coleofasciculus sp. FACHB-125]MBD1902220.1 cyanoexosortase A [Coleofasciculus sp. FACHB-125]